MTELPGEFVNKLISIYGGAGEKWLGNYNDLIAYCTYRWRIKLLPFEIKLSHSFIAPVLLEDGTKAILKLGVPGPGILSEIAALNAFDGRGFCKLLDAEPEKGILLLEYIGPGEPLTKMPDDAATTIVADLIKNMQTGMPVSGYPFQTSEDWYHDLIDLNQRFDSHIAGYLFDHAVFCYQSIKANPQEQRLLHGDLHQGNIIPAGNGGWKMIDPKGIVAETACELVPFLMNNLESGHIIDTISNRVSQFSEKLKIDKTRIIKWAAFRSVLSVYWKIEDNLMISAVDMATCECFYKLSC